MSHRTDILDRIESLLRAIPDIRDVVVNKSTPVDIDTIVMPYVFVYSGVETKLKDSRAVIGSETWDWAVILEVWATEESMEDLLAAIHAAMFADENFGGYASYSERMGVDMYVIDPTRALQSMLITYSVIYRHVQGVM